MSQSRELYFRLASELVEATGRQLHPAFLLLDAELAFPKAPTDSDDLNALGFAVGEIAKYIVEANLFAKVITVEDALAAVKRHYAARGTSLCPPVIGALEALLAELEALK